MANRTDRYTAIDIVPLAPPMPNDTYQRMEVHFVLVTPNSGGIMDVRYYHGSDWEQPVPHFSNLVLSASGFADKRSEGLQHYRARYEDVSAVEPADARGMVATYARLEKGMQKLLGNEGHPDTFANYVARVCRVLSVRKAVWRLPNGKLDSLGRTRRFDSVGEGIIEIAHRARAWQLGER